MENDTILEVRDLHTVFSVKEGLVKAVNGVSLKLRKGGILAVVGESGAGKTMLGLSILDLVPPPGKIVKGEVLLDGRNLLGLGKEEFRRVRGKDIAIVFQDATVGLNPVLTVGAQLDEMLTSHMRISKREARKLSLEALHRVGMPDPERIVNKYTFQLSGGMCQRVMLAIAVSLTPKVLIADEPTSSLDTTLQAEILDEMKRLRREMGSAILLITHDLGVVAQMADEVAVMYAGQVVEMADTLTLFKRAAHPYTWTLLQAVVRIDAPDRMPTSVRGAPPSLLNLPDECPFMPRCNKAMSVCRTSTTPTLREVEPNHFVACYNPVRHDWS